MIPPIRLCFFMWVIFLIQYSLGIDFGFLGIRPRSASGLIGIVTAPLIHGNFSHLMSNTVPLLILGGSLYFFYSKIAGRVFLHTYFFTGALVWIFGRSSYHIGASGMVYALASFLIFFGFFRGNFKTVIISLIILFFYGSLIFGLFPAICTLAGNHI